MPKFYVECGDIKEIIVAQEKYDACFQALQKHIRDNHGNESYMTTEFMVSEKGFPGDRESLLGEPFSIDTHELVEAKSILDRMCE